MMDPCNKSRIFFVASKTFSRIADLERDKHDRQATQEATSGLPMKTEMVWSADNNLFDRLMTAGSGGCG